MKPIIFLLLLFSTSRALGQNCTTRTGDTVLNITFGAGTNYGPPLSAGTTNMEYVQEQCPVDGKYTIINKTLGCWSAPHGWLDITRDHTGHPNGYFMLINGSVHPGDFYVQDIRGLCPGTTYEMAVWILCPDTAQAGNNANITFSFEAPDGSILKQSSTGNIPKMRSEKWLQYKVNFTMPSSTSSVVLRMRNNSYGGHGNDIAMDDITLRVLEHSFTASKMYFPTAFTPNHDGKNDLFRCLQKDFYSNYYLIIYNRWGQKVFETKEFATAWDGTFNGNKQPNDTYIWWCSYKKTDDEKRINLKGTVLLIR